MDICADGGSSRVSIPHHLRKTLHTIREITGKQHSDEDIFSVYKDSFNDPHETAQKLLFLDTFHEVKSKREKRKENLVPLTQRSVRNGRRNFASSKSYQGNGRSASFKKENGVNHVKGGSRTSMPVTNKARKPHAIKVSGPTNVPSGVSNHEAQDDLTATVNKGLTEKNPLTKSTFSSKDDVELEISKAISEPVATPVDNQPAELQSSTFSRQDPSLISASSCSSQCDKITEIETASNKGKTHSLLKSDVTEKSHVTFPFHLQSANVLQNGLTFGSFDFKFVKEASCNNGASGREDSHFESFHGTGEDEGESSPNTNAIPVVAFAREEEESILSEDKGYAISNSAPGAELALPSDHIARPVEGVLKEEALSNTETHHIAYGQEAPVNVIGLIPSLSALGQPVNTEAAEIQPGNSNVPAIALVSYPPDHCSIAASFQQSTHLFRQQYPLNYYPYGPYYSPFYMPPPYIQQFLSPNGIPQQSYFPPGVAVAAPSHIKPTGNTGNPPITNLASHTSSTVATHIPPATALDSIHSEEKASPVTESSAAWIGQGLGNLQVSPMYNLALQGQPLGFPVMQASHSGLMGIHQPSQPIAVSSTTYQTLPPPPNTGTAMVEPIVHRQIAYQPPQAAITNWVNNN